MEGISVVIPLYNKATTVGRALDSALGQEGPHEVVVVDDGSTDGSDEVARSYGARIRYVRQDNAGPGVARNRAVAATRYPVVAFLDADDEYLPGCLASHLECRRVRPDTRLTLAPFRVVDEQGRTTDYPLIDRPIELERVGDFHYATGFSTGLHSGFIGSALCIDKELFHSLGGFDERLNCWEIADLLFRVVVRGTRVGILDGYRMVSHRSSANSQFERTRQQTRFLAIHAQNILDSIEAVPTGQRAAALSPAKHCMRRLLQQGAVAEFRAIADRMQPSWCDSLESKLLRAARRLPDPILRAVMPVLLRG